MTRRPHLLWTAMLALPLLAATPLLTPASWVAAAPEGSGATAAPAPDDVPGPPWISVEHPANPHHPDTRGALALIHTYHHGDARQFTVTGHAVGIVDGERVSVPLGIRPTYRPGVYAVRGELPEGAWVLAVNMKDRDASALMALDRAGHVTAVRVPGTHRDGWMIPRTATTADINDLLRVSVAVADQVSRAALQSAPSAPR